MTGRTIAHYEILEKLGEGGMGVVYKARDTHLDRSVAIKVLPPEKVADAERKRRFVQEAKAASALNHPHIVTIHDISHDGGVDFIAMEHVAGRSLDRAIGRKGLALNEALKCAVQIADALAAAHAAGIVHRDLKPGNIMVTEAGQVKLLDFGLAKLTEPASGEDAPTETLKPHTEEGAIVGTVAYMSPEQAQGLPVDARSDIFSFGALLYEMLTGRRAFQGDTKVATLAAILKQEPAPLAADVPHDLERLIARCLRKQPERRFQHMADIKVALEELKEESESGSQTVAPVLKRSKLWAWIAAGVALALLIGGGIWLRRGGTTAAPMKVVPLTSYPGRELTPALSPDGNQVAFVWDGEKQDNYDIYIKLIDGGAPLRLTTDPAPDSNPTWSPEGRRIAFRRGAGVYVIPALGGPERRVGESLGTGALSWSPDGKHLAMADRDPPGAPMGIFLLDLESGEKRRLTTSPKGILSLFGDMQPAFCSDGGKLAFIRIRSANARAIYQLSLTAEGAPAGEPQRLTADEVNASGLDWSQDGRSLVFSGSQGLMRARADAPGAVEPIPVQGTRVSGPSVARRGNRLAYAQSAFDTNIWQIATAGKPDPTRLIASTRNEFAPKFSPDGRRIAFLSDQSGSMELWICGSDGASPVQLTTLGGPAAGSPRWSPDGQKIAFDASLEGHYEVYVVSTEGGRPRRLTTERSNQTRPSWSPDGRWLFFASDRTGEMQIWRIPAEGGAAQQVTRKGGREPIVSWDGAFVYYVRHPAPGIWRVPAEGGEETQALSRGLLGQWALSADGIYLRDTEVPSIEFYRFGADQPVEIARFPKETFAGQGTPANLAVSPDGKWILYVQTDRVESDLMLVENFR